MARMRTIKPGFFTNDELVELGAFTRLCFIGLWTLADRAGRLEDRPKKIKMEIFPGDDLDIDAMLSDLAAHGFLIRYEHGASRYIQVVNFEKHQSPHVKEAPSTIPAPDSPGASTVQAPLVMGSGIQELVVGSGRECTQPSARARANGAVPNGRPTPPPPEHEGRLYRAPPTPVPEPFPISEALEEYWAHHAKVVPRAERDALFEREMDQMVQYCKKNKILSDDWEGYAKSWILRGIDKHLSRRPLAAR